MNKEEYMDMIQRYNVLKQFIIENEFNDIEYRKVFDDAEFDILSHLTFNCWRYANKSSDITYSEQTMNIAHTILNKDRITYKQFRVLCFFYKRYDYRLSNPAKDVNNVKVKKELLHKNYLDNM